MSRLLTHVKNNFQCWNKEFEKIMQEVCSAGIYAKKEDSSFFKPSPSVNVKNYLNLGTKYPVCFGLYCLSIQMFFHTF